jgi:hypothetical protein
MPQIFHHVGPRCSEWRRVPLESVSMIVGVAPPDRIPIKREVGYRTDQIGHHAQGKFLGGVIGEYLGGWLPGMSREDLRWYAYLHHLTVTAHTCVPTSSS